MNSITLPLGKIKSNKSNKAKKVSAKKAGSVWTQNLTQASLIKIACVVLVLTLIGAGSWRIAKFYNGKIFPNVKVAGVKVGGKTPVEAKIAIQSNIDKLNTSGVKISSQDKQINPTLTDLGLTFNADQVANDAYNFGRSGNWQTKVKDNFAMVTGRAKVKLIPQIDEKKFDEKLNQIAQVVTVPAQNANIVITDGNITITPSKIGQGVDKKKLESDITNLINENKLDSTIAIVSSDLAPDVAEPGTKEAQEQAIKFMSVAPIPLTYEGKQFSATKTDVGKWIEFSPKGNKLVANVSSDRVGEFATWVAGQIEIRKVDKEIMEGTNQVLEEGRDGLGVDTKDLVKNITDRVLSAKTGSAIAISTYTVPKGEVYKNPHAQPCRYDTRYIDINLSEETLYAFEGCNLVNQFLVSTGLTGPTPTGEFHVYNKSRVTRMTGPGYDLPGVEWVSWFTGDYSIHGTYWHNNFGHPMSHGCVNASNGDAEWVYNWDDVGTPVYIHW